ncbi:alkene reductase [Lusitaniella coriacea LEGE 07157]|uniref:Alkene reductase n=1 Tax=Lusitaniella coriacea LEGE 07157 TaxID=945747 RepID=A0A8J7JA67_9CYAN|nr:alkene reductase [Lusitaniella coriacea]MBE9116070.1 alkene reductase [Lusitaniella coriacea LEGE 07157]
MSISTIANSALAELFQPLHLGKIALPNRIIMAPLTRARSGVDRVPNDLMLEYYTQRAGAGLIITEGTHISEQGIGWEQSPGIYTSEQVAGWKKITEAVHQKGGKIVLQLWHMGRASHPDFQPGSVLPVSASAIPISGEIHTPNGKKPHPTPRALTLEEIPGVIEQYVTATRNAREAGFDGVEIHGANGYLIDQFLRDCSNHRVDEYGGSIENRVRFLLEVTEAVVREWSRDRVGVRLSPYNPYNDMKDSDPIATFTHAAAALNPLNLAYLHIMEPLPGHPLAVEGVERATPSMRREFQNAIILNGGYDAQKGASAIQDNEGDAIAYGVPFIANPDLVTRFQQRAPLNEANPATFYTHDREGYIDYPTLAA